MTNLLLNPAATKNTLVLLGIVTHNSLSRRYSKLRLIEHDLQPAARQNCQLSRLS